MTDYAQMLLEGMDVLIKERLKSINYDATIKCVITNAINAADGKYEVSNGGATFFAYSDKTDYKKDDSVLVIIPNNNYDNQKYILGKDTSDSDTPYVYNPPFSIFVDITGNLCSKSWTNEGEGLWANGYRMGIEPHQLIIEDDGRFGYKESFIWEANLAYESETDETIDDLYDELDEKYNAYTTLSSDQISLYTSIIKKYIYELQQLVKQFCNSTLTQEEYNTRTETIHNNYIELLNTNNNVYSNYLNNVLLPVKKYIEEINYYDNNGNMIENVTVENANNYFLYYKDVMRAYLLAQQQILAIANNNMRYEAIFYKQRLEEILNQYQNGEITKEEYNTTYKAINDTYCQKIEDDISIPSETLINDYLININDIDQSESLDLIDKQYKENTEQYIDNVSPYIGYDRLGISADFQTFLSNYNLATGDYGLVLYVFTYGEIKPYKFLFSAQKDFFGDIYNFDSYFNQEIVFNISDIKDKPIIKMELYFYQDQNFKDVHGQYILSKDFTEDQRNIFEEKKYTNLTEFFTSDDYVIDLDDISNLFQVNILPNLYVRDVYIALGYDASNFEGDDLAYLTFNPLTVHYDSSQTEDELAKFIELRWIHKEDTGGISTIGRSRYATMSDYLIVWYHEVLATASPDNWAGENWEIIFSSAAGPSSALETANNNAMFQRVIPDVALAQNRYKVIILQREDIGYRLVARSNIVTFKNSEEVENTTQTDILNGLAIHCGYMDKTTSKLVNDAQQGMFYIYKKGNELEDSSMAQEIFSTIPTFVSVKRYDNIVPYLTEASKVVWTIPASHSMIIPQYNNKMVTKNTSIPLSSGQKERFFNNDVYGDYRYYIDGKTDGEGTQVIAYNALLDTYEYSFTDYPQLFKQIGSEFFYIALFEYKIRSTFSPAYINNTIQLDVEKDKNKYHAERTLYFGQSGTSGSDYTLVIDFEEHQQALSLYSDSSTGYARDLGDAANQSIYQLLPYIRLVDQTGHEVVDLADEAVRNKYTITWDWLTSEVNGDIKTSVDTDTNFEVLYPVFFADSTHVTNIYGCTGRNRASGVPYGSAFGYRTARNSTAIAAEDKADARYALFDAYNAANVPESEWTNYYFWDRINNVFVQNYDALNPNVQYYRYRQPQESNIRNRNFYRYTFKKVIDEENFTTFKRYFINVNGSYILDYNNEYRNEQNYYIPIYKGTQSSNTGNNYILKILNPDSSNYNGNQYKVRITLNNGYRYNSETHIPYIYDIMNSLSILRVTVEGVKDYPLVAYAPIALRRVDYKSNNLSYLPLSITGATYVRYSSAGDLPDFYHNPYTIKYFDKSLNYQDIKIDNTQNQDSLDVGYITEPWSLICPTAIENDLDSRFEAFMTFIPAEIDGKNMLSPFSTYIKEAPLYGVQYKDINGIARWTQPIFVYQDNYPSSTLNEWNGTDLDIDEDNGTILATAIGAGKKETDNTFSGVILGDWSKGDNSAEIAEQTGVYGFSHGAMSYALKEDGTAFFGKDGHGRIILTGDKAQIYSSNWLDKTPEGMMIDLDDGYLKMQHNARFIEITFNSLSTYTSNYNRDDVEWYMYRPFIPETIRTISLEDVGYDDDSPTYKLIKSYYIPVNFIEYVSAQNTSNVPYYLFNREINTISEIVDQMGKDSVLYSLSSSGIIITKINYKEEGNEIKCITTIERYWYYDEDNNDLGITLGTTLYRVSRYQQISELNNNNQFSYTTDFSKKYLYRKMSLGSGKINVKTGEVFNENSNITISYPALINPVYNAWNPTIRYFQRDISSANKHHYLELGNRISDYALTIGTQQPNDIRDTYPQFKVEWDGTAHISGDVNVYDGHSVNVYGGDVNVDEGGGVNIYKGGKLLIYDNDNNLAIAAGSKNELGSAKYDGITGSLVIYNDGNMILDGGNIYAYDGIIYGGEIRGGLFTRQISAGNSIHTMHYQLNHNTQFDISVDSSSKTKYFEGVYGEIYEAAEDIKAFEREHALVDIDAGFLGEWFVTKNSMISRDTGTYFFSNGIDGMQDYSPMMSSLRVGGIHSLQPPFQWNGKPTTRANIVTERVRVFHLDKNDLTSWADVGTFSGERVTYSNTGEASGTKPTTLLGIMTKSSNNGLGIQAEGTDSDVGIKSFYGGVYISGGYRYKTDSQIPGRADFYIQNGAIKIISESSTTNAGAANGATGSTTPISIQMNKGVLSITTAKPEDQVGIYARFA